MIPMCRIVLNIALVISDISGSVGQTSSAEQ